MAFADIGGWDHHSNEAPQLTSLSREFALSLTAFVRDLERYQLENKLASLPAVDVPTPGLARIGLRRETLVAPPFRGTIRLDARGNLAFAQRDRNGLCGIERMSAVEVASSSALAITGNRGLWVSNPTGARAARSRFSSLPSRCGPSSLRT